MQTKKVFHRETAYLLGILILAFSTALMARADFGISMIVAPAYLLHLKLSQYFSFFTFGMAEYVFQAVVLLILTLVMRRFKLTYLFSFVTAVFYGFTLDLCIYLVGLFPSDAMAWRLVFYVFGVLLGSLGVAFLFRTYFPPEAYELFVKEVSGKLNKRIDRVKTVYDCTSCLIGIALSFVFFGFGHFEGIKLGTVLCAAVNGFLIGRISRSFDKHLTFCDALPLRSFFER